MALGFLIIPSFGMAQVADQVKTGYRVVLDCKDGDPIKGTLNSEGKEEISCTFSDFMRQVDHIIGLLLFVATFLAVISFVYAGFRLIFSGGNEDAVKQAKHIFLNVVVGLVLAYGAWLIVHFFVTTVGVKPDYTLLK